jgi:hypothetical protein
MINEEFRVALSNDKKYTIALHNITGRLLNLKENCQYQTVMNVSNLPPGIYVVTVFNDNIRKSIKLIKR